MERGGGKARIHGDVNKAGGRVHGGGGDICRNRLGMVNEEDSRVGRVAAGGEDVCDRIWDQIGKTKFHFKIREGKARSGKPALFRRAVATTAATDIAMSAIKVGNVEEWLVVYKVKGGLKGITVLG